MKLVLYENLNTDLCAGGRVLAYQAESLEFDSPAAPKTWNPTPGKWRWENQEFEVVLRYIVSSCLKPDWVT